MTTIVLLGPPGSGKGTQAAKLAENLGVPAISTGEILRREVQTKSELGARVQALLTSGQLVGDALMNEVVTKRLAQADCLTGCILDGYPRTAQQAEFLEGLLQQRGVPQPIVFDFVVSPEEVIERLSLRRQCPKCGMIFSAEFDVYGKDMLCDRDGTALVRRADDNPDAIRERLAIYSRNSAELVTFYKAGRYREIRAVQSPEEITAELLALLKQENVLFDNN
jgi:adenylate kinase